MLAYFLKVNVAIVLFYAFYRLFFYKDTFFGWRRMALLCFFATSAAVPLLDIQTWITAQEPMVAMADLYATVVLPELVITPNAPTDWKSMILEYAGIAYWGIVTLLALRLLNQLAGIIRLGYRCRKVQMGGVNIHLLPKEAGPFSFFHWIFINLASHTEEELNEILIHEQTHARQWHSIDVIVSELACILCWFNPFAWLMKREIRTNLEYMADARVLENGYDSKTYQYHLLGLSHHKAAATIYNSFNVLPLKKRIKMMNKKRTREIGRTKYLMFLPLAALLMIISNIEAVARTTKEIATEVLTIVDAQSMKSLNPSTSTEVMRDSIIDPNETIFEVVERMPEFPGGIEAILKFISDYINYPAEAQKAKIQGRVIVQFIIDKEGFVKNITVKKSVSPSLDKEAIRIVKNMPKWKPGTQRGKAVNVRYSLPIMFKLPDPAKKNKPAYEQLKEVVVEGSGRETNTVFEVVEQMPEFLGGMSGIMQYLSANLVYPPEAKKAGKQGRVVVQMVIDREGNVTEVKTLRSVDPALDKEAIRVVSSMPKWKPAMQKGQKVRVRYTLPIMFRAK